MTVADVVWGFGRLTIQPTVRIFAGLRVYGKDRVPVHGGAVVAVNHFSWLDPPAVGSACPRTIYYMAKSEAHGVPGLGQLIRAFGAFSVRRGESDREAVRRARDIVREGKLLGLFVEGTRQLSGVPGEVQHGAAMVALQEGAPVLPAAVHGTHDWRFGHVISVAWGEPVRFDGLGRNAKGYREASGEIQLRIRRLWEFLVDLHEVGRPDVAVPPP